MQVLKNLIEEGLKEKSVSVKQKYLWLKDKYNKAVDEYNDITLQEID